MIVKNLHSRPVFSLRISTPTTGNPPPESLTTPSKGVELQSPEIRHRATMFNDVVHFQNLTLMPLTSVTDCTQADGTATPGAASSVWPGTQP